MLTRGVTALRTPLICAEDCIRPRVCRSAQTLRLRPYRYAPYVTISDPPPHGGPSHISLAHPKDPSNLAGSGPSTSSFPTPPDPPPTPEPSETHASPGSSEDVVSPQGAESSVPAKYVHPTDPQLHLPLPHAPNTMHASPPFNTHKFVKVLETSFPVPVARHLMRVCRALLIDRLGRVKRDALTTQDLESQAYLFKAALSELRTELSVITRNETAAMRTATAALRRDVDSLDSRMKEAITTLKHEIQMDLDSRKNEAKDDLKRIDIHVEEMLSRALITISELKTQVEESRWEKMRAAVGALAVLSLVIVVSVEIFVVQPKNKKHSDIPPPPTDILPPANGAQPWVT